MIVVFNAKFALLLAAHANENTMIAEEARLQNHVLLVEIIDLVIRITISMVEIH